MLPLQAWQRNVYSTACYHHRLDKGMCIVLYVTITYRPDQLASVECRTLPLHLIDIMCAPCDKPCDLHTTNNLIKKIYICDAACEIPAKDAASYFELGSQRSTGVKMGITRLFGDLEPLMYRLHCPIEVGQCHHPFCPVWTDCGGPRQQAGGF